MAFGEAHGGRVDEVMPSNASGLDFLYPKRNFPTLGVGDGTVSGPELLGDFPSTVATAGLFELHSTLSPKDKRSSVVQLVTVMMAGSSSCRFYRNHLSALSPIFFVCSAPSQTGQIGGHDFGRASE